MQKKLNCKIVTGASDFWPEHKYCKVTKVDLSKKSKLTFNVTQNEKIEEISVVQFWFGRYVYHIPREILQQFPKLNGVRINRYKIETLRGDLFPGEFKRLEYLDLSENRIEEIGSFVFQSLTELKWLNLNQNRIYHMEELLLIKNVKLTYIFCHGNRIESLRSHIVSYSSPLEYVDFRENSENVNKEYTCRNTKCPIKLPNIYEYENLILEEEKTKWLKCRYLRLELYLWPENQYCQVIKSGIYHSEYILQFEFSGTDVEKEETTAVQFSNSYSIDFIPVEMFREFPSLNGLSIELSSIPTLKNNLFTIECEKLEFLSLAYNEIKVIQEIAFKNLTRLKWLNFEGNSIKNLNYQVFAYNNKLTYISFELGSIEMINRKLFRSLKNLKAVNFEGNKCADTQIKCQSPNCNLKLYKKLLPCFEDCSASQEDNKPNELRVLNVGFSSAMNTIQTLNCTFKIFSKPHTAKFCEIEDAELTEDKKGAVFRFEGSEVKKKESTGIYFTLCYDTDFVPTQIFKEFPSIDRLGIKYSSIPVIRNNIFTSEFDKIKYLLLSNNLIKTIKPEAFQHLKKLKFIDLSFNKIESLKSNIFKNNRRLESILLNNNQIKMLNTNLFHNLQKLVNLNFKRNKCANKINAYEFKQLKRDLSKCYENCESDEVCKTKAAEELEAEKEFRSINCDYNQIKWKNRTSCFVANTELRSDIIYEISNAENRTDNVEAVYFKSSPVVEIIPLGLIEDFPNLNSIAFHDSKIPILKANLFTQSFIQIKEILLKENGIQQIEDEAFQELEDLEEIDLSFNQIKSINKELFSHNSNLRMINLSGNKIFMIQRDSFMPLSTLEELSFLGNECINKKFGCYLFQCPDINETNNYLEDCFSNYLEQAEKLENRELLNFLL
jgi:Leucine-rich repeat (LRR) protein